jgi:hypothetical protein
MKYTEKEILDALHLIKYLCTTYYKSNLCKDCPFSNKTGDCMIHKEFPDNWSIKVKSPFKAFNE